MAPKQGDRIDQDRFPQMYPNVIDLDEYMKSVRKGLRKARPGRERPDWLREGARVTIRLHPDCHCYQARLRHPADLHHVQDRLGTVVGFADRTAVPGHHWAVEFDEPMWSTYWKTHILGGTFKPQELQLSERPRIVLARR